MLVEEKKGGKTKEEKKRDVFEIDVVPCKICGSPTTYTTDNLCENCWEVVSRLDRFLKHVKGVEHVKKLLEERGIKFSAGDEMSSAESEF